MNNTKYHNYEIQYKELNDRDRSIVHYITTPDRDRQGEIVNPFGMNDKDFSKAPSVFYNHNYNLPVGKSLWRQPESEGVLAKTKFGSTDFAKDIYTLHKEDIIRTWSIGFRIAENEKSISFDELTETMFIDSWELIEYSSAPVAVNPNCLDKIKTIVKSIELKHEVDLLEAQNKLFIVLNDHTKEIEKMKMILNDYKSFYEKEIVRINNELKSLTLKETINNLQLTKTEITSMFLKTLNGITGRKFKNIMDSSSKR
jgi:hypothetical protein